MLLRRSNGRTHLFEVAHERRTFVANQVNASFVKLQLGDPRSAKSLAESALAAAREIAFPLFEAAALANLGNAERALGHPTLAIEYMEAGIAARRPIQESRDYVDDLADLTLAYAEAGLGAAALIKAKELCAIGSPFRRSALAALYLVGNRTRVGRRRRGRAGRQGRGAGARGVTAIRPGNRGRADARGLFVSPHQRAHRRPALAPAARTRYGRPLRFSGEERA